ncbi:MAG: YceH family protein [Solirubrobacteraceae bacterium]
MHIATLTDPERRVLGCLIEKRFTTPDQYPLTLNALRLACNQSTNRDPVVDYGPDTVREAAQRLTLYGLARLASGHSSRATKYRHLADEALSLSPGQLAVLVTLLLRGPQTPGELKARSERMVDITSLAELDAILAELVTRHLAQRLERRPGQKEDRYTDLLGNPGAQFAAEPTAAVQEQATEPETLPGSSSVPDGGSGSGLMARVEALEQQVAALQREIQAIRRQSV